MRENVSGNWRNIPDCPGQPLPEKIEIICSLLVINHQLLPVLYQYYTSTIPVHQYYTSHHQIWEYSLSVLAWPGWCGGGRTSWYSLLSLLLPLCMHLLLDYSLTLAS